MSAPGPDPNLPPLTIVTCIESGILESEVPLMVETLRRFGGRFSQCPVIAVGPRWVASSLRSQTRKELDDLGVQVIEHDVRHRYNWMGFINKPTGLLLAAPHVKTEHAVWLDGDVLVASPPEAMAENLDLDVLASVEEMGPTSTGPDHPFDTFWARMAEIGGLTLDQIPWVTRPFSRTKVRIYFNAGIFRYKIGIGFEQAYLKSIEDLLDARIMAKGDRSIFLHEQLAFGLTIPRNRFSFGELDDAYNFHVEDVYEPSCPISKYPQVSLFHYHRTLRGPYRPKFLAQLRPHFPELAELVEARPYKTAHGLAKLRNLPRRLLYELRQRKTASFTKTCELV